MRRPSQADTTAENTLVVIHLIETGAHFKRSRAGESVLLREVQLVVPVQNINSVFLLPKSVPDKHETPKNREKNILRKLERTTALDNMQLQTRTVVLRRSQPQQS